MNFIVKITGWSWLKKISSMKLSPGLFVLGCLLDLLLWVLSTDLFVSGVSNKLSILQFLNKSGWNLIFWIMKLFISQIPVLLQADAAWTSQVREYILWTCCLVLKWVSMVIKLLGNWWGLYYLVCLHEAWLFRHASDICLQNELAVSA